MKHLYPGHKKLRLHQCGSAPNKRANQVGIGRCPFFFTQKQNNACIVNSRSEILKYLYLW